MKKSIFIGLCFSLIILLNSTCYASKVEINKDKEELEPGDSITIKINVADIDEDGINVIQGKLEYNQNIFEKIVSSDFECKNNWSIAYNDEDTDSQGKFILMNLSAGVWEDQEIAEVTLKVKEDVNKEETQIKISQLCTTKDDEVISMEDSETKVQINGKENRQNVFIKLWFETIKKLFHIK